MGTTAALLGYIMYILGAVYTTIFLKKKNKIDTVVSTFVLFCC
jgi:hypothetical protein